MKILLKLSPEMYPKIPCLQERDTSLKTKEPAHVLPLGNTPISFPSPFSLHRHPSPKLWGTPGDLKPREQWAVAAHLGLNPWARLQGPFSPTSQRAESSPAWAHFLPIKCEESQCSPACTILLLPLPRLSPCFTVPSFNDHTFNHLDLGCEIFLAPSQEPRFDLLVLGRATQGQVSFLVTLPDCC